MSIQYQILGRPGRDNAMFVWVNSGTQFFRLLFDCGEGLLREIRQSDIKAIDHLFFSHTHIDHIAGFDYFFRRNYDREEKPVYVWGPEKTSGIIQHRLLGFIWNLISEAPGKWYVTDISESSMASFSFKTKEGFEVKHFEGETDFNGLVLETPGFKVKAAIMNHIIPTIAYVVSENDSLNINKAELLQSGLPQGAWLEKLKDLRLDENEIISLDGNGFRLKDLREKLLITTPGEKIAYLTDFVNDDLSRRRAIELIEGCDTVVCESQYSYLDEELAKKNYHMTTRQTASLAKEAGAKKLILFHVSERYSQEEDYPALLQEARKIFPETYFPEEWEIPEE
ncbi:MAG TPA: MBL fold metallo-hydrolase [Ignavibacteriales bacterium]|nr:MBL fold metallo-hydrolase [Ignavibacteriales bacterium]